MSKRFAAIMLMLAAFVGTGSFSYHAGKRVSDAWWFEAYGNRISLKPSLEDQMAFVMEYGDTCDSENAVLEAFAPDGYRYLAKFRLRDNNHWTFERWDKVVDWRIWTASRDGGKTVLASMKEVNCKRNGKAQIGTNVDDLMALPEIHVDIPHPISSIDSARGAKEPS